MGILSIAFLAPQFRRIVVIEPLWVTTMSADESPPLELPTALPNLAPAGSPFDPAILEIPATTPGSPNIAAPTAGHAPAPRTPTPATVALRVPPATLSLRTDLPVGGGFEGRQADARSRLVVDRGGTPQSEAAVERGLAWLIAHQHADGGWRFDHQSGACAGRCSSSGQHESTTAATALALLPLLGAGHTSQAGDHAVAVERGLTYLASRMIVTAHGGDLQEGTMYGQGLATIALCEAYALTADERWGNAAEGAIEFIVYTQHPAGGWRYFPGQRGDTTVLGWQWMALKSGQLSGLNVPADSLTRASAFLDSVECDGGAAYGYQLPEADRSPTAIGLLCRMYSGWRRVDERIIRGCDLLAAWGPSYDDLYFNYYAAQVLHHAEAPQWAAWNERLREHLLATQAVRGHEEGSWHFGDYHTAAGGRLCDTSLALLILEVYYRHLPLYGSNSVEL